LRIRLQKKTDGLKRRISVSDFFELRFNTKTVFYKLKKTTVATVFIMRLRENSVQYESDKNQNGSFGGFIRSISVSAMQLNS